MSLELHRCANRWTKFGPCWRVQKLVSRGVERDGAHDQRRSVAEPGKFRGAPAAVMYGRAS
jgi:hypothetical protein